LAVFALADPAGDEARLVDQPGVDGPVGGDEALRGKTHHNRSHRNNDPGRDRDEPAPVPKADPPLQARMLLIAGAPTASSVAFDVRYENAPQLAALLQALSCTFPDMPALLSEDCYPLADWVE
jgi:hypothetical protein